MYKKLIAVIMPLLCSSPCWSHEDMWVIIWATGKHGSEETGIGTNLEKTPSLNGWLRLPFSWLRLPFSMSLITPLKD